MRKHKWLNEHTSLGSFARQIDSVAPGRGAASTVVKVTVELRQNGLLMKSWKSVERVCGSVNELRFEETGTRMLSKANSTAPLYDPERKPGHPLFVH
jgi:hypothetical protein